MILQFIKEPLNKHQIRSLFNESVDGAIHVSLNVSLQDWFKYIEETYEPATNYLSTLICGSPTLTEITYHITSVKKDKICLEVSADPSSFLEESIDMEDYSGGDPLEDEEEELI